MKSDGCPVYNYLNPHPACCICTCLSPMKMSSPMICLPPCSCCLDSDHCAAHVRRHCTGCGATGTPHSADTRQVWPPDHCDHGDHCDHCPVWLWALVWLTWLGCTPWPPRAAPSCTVWWRVAAAAVTWRRTRTKCTATATLFIEQHFLYKDAG